MADRSTVLAGINISRNGDTLRAGCMNVSKL